MALVSIKNLTKQFGKVKAVRNLSMEVEEGTIMGLIGPNGSGKTTTIKVILGLLKPEIGSVKVYGQNPWDNPEIRAKIGVIYEKPTFPSYLKVIEYLERVCRIYQVPETRAFDMLDKVELQREAHTRKIKGLSAGMHQKFALAHALIHQPDFIIADEPTSNLDPQARNDLINLILTLNQTENVTFLISSHILPEINHTQYLEYDKRPMSDSLIEFTQALGALKRLALKTGIIAIMTAVSAPHSKSKPLGGTYLAHTATNIFRITLKAGKTSNDYRLKFSLQKHPTQPVIRSVLKKRTRGTQLIPLTHFC